MQSKDFFNQMEFVTLRLHNLESDEQFLVANRVYSLWLKIWEKVFSEKGLTNAVNTDDFFRQHIAHVLLWQENVVGFIMGTVFDPRLSAHLQHGYLASLDRENIKRKLPNSTARILSMEYLSVNEEYRKTTYQGVSLGEVLIGLSLKSLGSIGCDFAIGTPRVDIHVDKMAEKMGMWRLQEPIYKYQYECDVVASRKSDTRQIVDPNIAQLVDTLWSKQNKYFDRNNVIYLKRAA